MTIRRVALIFDPEVCPHTTGVYCRRALEKQAECTHVLPGELGDIPPNRFDLFLNVDDGLRYRLPRHLRPSAWWAIDTHLDLEWYLDKGREFDLIFAAQRDGAERLRQAGLAPVEWLPLACDPELHHCNDAPKQFDVAFVGRVLAGERHALLQTIVERFPNTFVGQQYFDDMARVFASARVIFNRSVRNDVNMRVFEALCSGSLLVTNDLEANGQAELFQDGVHLATYRDAAQLLERIRYYQAHADERERIAAEGRREVLKHHTYAHRVERMLAVAREHLASEPRVQRVSPPSEREGTSACGSPPPYFDLLRPELLDRVPHNARRILDIGCGTGRLGAAIKQRQTAHVTGIEFDSSAAAVAVDRLDCTYVGDVELLDPPIAAGSLDCVICGDVLEHLRDPQALLRRIHDWLTPQGRLVASIPNVRHHSLVAALLDGDWTYEPAGLLDATHRRLMTRSDIEQLLESADLELLQLESISGPGDPVVNEFGPQAPLRIGRMCLEGLDPNDAREFFTYQYLVVASPYSVGQRVTCRHELMARGALSADERHQLDLLRRPVGRILHLDCGAAALGALLQQTGEAAVTGTMEATTELPLARRRLTDVVMGCVPQVLSQFDAGQFDWVILGRLLEQVPDPVALLDGVRRVLHPEGRFVGLVNNLRHQRRIQRLLQGQSPQELTGPDAPCRLFTRRELEKLLFRAAYQPLAIDLADSRPTTTDAPFGEFHSGNLHIAGLQGEEATEFEAEHLVFCGTPRQRPDFGLTSIIVLTHNEFAYTHACVESLRFRTDLPYELIFVDNGSTDGTVEYLRSIPGVKLIANPENRGFPAGVNQGLALATGRQVLLLNNDTLLTTGWLERLLGALYAEANIGLVGPASNCVGSEQQIDVGYSDLAGLDGFAWELAKRERGQRVDTQRLVGFCLLIRRAVLDEVGHLDERFGQGMFEDDDLCRRARDVGWRAVIARDAFVHHFGSRTFRATGTDFENLLCENRDKFAAKWAGHPEFPPEARFPSATSPTSTAFWQLTMHESGGLQLVPSRSAIQLSLCMIVRNNEQTIRPCLESIRPWVDEMIVVDTGSTDATPHIARELGARVTSFPWCDDFALARNESLRHARGEWLFWMDSDDTITPECGRGLRELIAGLPDSRVLGFVMKVHCPGGDPTVDGDVTVVDHVKLFRNHPSLRFEGRIHEQIIPAIRRLGGEVAWTDLYVLHSGSDQSEEGRRGKHQRDLRILHLDLAERPDHPFVLFNLGMTYTDMSRFDLAASYLERALAVANPQESHVRKVYALLIGAYAAMGQLELAWGVCTKGRALFPKDPELRFRQGILQQQRGELDAAKESYRTLLAESDDLHFSSIDRGILGYKTRQNLAVVLTELGDLAGAEDLWRQVVQEQPSHRDGWRGLGECLIRQQNLSAAEDLAAQLAGNSAFTGDAQLIRARIAMVTGDPQTAGELLSDAVACNPTDAEVLRLWCQYLFEAGRLVEAQTALTQLVALCPDDAAALHNLGAVFVRLNDGVEAERVLVRSLQLRPDSPATRELLSAARQLATA